MTDPTLARLHHAALIATLVVLCLFSAEPALDIALSSRFLDPQGVFALRGNPAITTLNDSLRWGLTAFALLAVALPVLARTLGFTPRSGLAGWHFLATVFVIGPGLIVNGILKAYAGRARPADIIEFGGTRQFTPVLQISDQCSQNCSFSSGEVAMTATFAFALLALTWPHLPKPRRWLAVAAAAALIGASLLLRVGMGRHFTSDALASVAISAFVVMGGYRLFNLGTARQQMTWQAIHSDGLALSGHLQRRFQRLAAQMRRLLPLVTAERR
ncbi:membrane-associated PAP2 superfamily phosphatase [Gemmobacter caeni]|jgi:membrane-associated PAP2 superfamily phosphatase|uniref:Membrane-associated PAP2 superfamily phosphatase n=2 Tax=Gemmobacter TaxID=204456 RepID=A0A2T6B359_9RHOB|nr:MULTISPECIES: phosphatase PAP2 family protein [Gemmobacter]PTX50463.1 membrane-associated PAP2 superfamily phosphatase [Gemmobacter caeni]TWI98320.1 membrane-associated PAP2 superfamily phosphatase [Gemmobacter caeni]GHC27630.1 phosphoesterase [Gemmobacter nanjingensis]